MKNIPIILAFACLGTGALASIPQTKLSTKIDGVTVYLSGAAITRTGSASLEMGMREILITGLSPLIIPGSVQVGGTGDYTLLSVSTDINYLEPQQQSKAIKSLEDSLKLLQGQLDLEKSMLSVYTQEEAMLKTNQKIGGDEKGVDVQQLIAAVDYFRRRMTEVKKMQLESNRKIQELSETVNRIQNQLSGMRANNQPVGEILLMVQADTRTNASFRISYLVPTAGWQPTYDIRVKDTKSAPGILFKAIITQESGEDWNDVKLTLSTADPSRSNTLPVLNPWHLSYQRPLKNMAVAYDGDWKAEDMPVMMMETEISALPRSSGVRGQRSVQDYTAVVDAETNVEYQISLPYSIESTGKALTIEVASYILDATYTYYSIPKIDKDAFLKARVTGWEKYEIIPGNSNIFFEGTLVGTAYINARYAIDTLDLSLGRDKRIIIERNTVKEVAGKTIIGTSKKDTYGYEIKVRNNKKEDIDLVIEDQIPVSKSTEIEVSKLDDSGARLDAETGKLTWSLRMAPAESKNLRFGFSVKYPKEQVIYIR